MQVDAKIPAFSQEILREADKLGLKYKFNPQVDLEQLDPDLRRVQVRMENVAPQANVLSYANQMKAGVVFPPGFITLDYYVVDCNTRVKAGKKAKLSTFPMFVLQHNYANASDELRQKIHILAAAANQKGAQRLKTAEVIHAAADALKLGLNNKRIMELTGISPAAINRLRRQAAARERLHSVGMPVEPLPLLDILGSPEIVALNNEPFKRLALLIKDAGLSAKESRNIAKQLKKDGSDQAAITSLSNYRNELDEQIRQHAMTGNGKPPPAAKLRQALGSVLAFEEQKIDATDRNPATAQTHLDKIDGTLEYLNTLHGQQKAIVNAIEAKEARARDIAADHNGDGDDDI